MGYGIKTSNPDRYSILKDFAKKNRREMTQAEQLAWEHLRGIQDFRFRRQHPIGDYIADFICLKAKLIIEIDGGYHNETGQIEDDAARQSVLERLGYTVLRFSNEAVLYDVQNVIREINELLLTMK